MLLNLMAALSLASVGAVAGIASDPQSVDGVELIKPNVLVKRDLVMTSTITQDDIVYPVNYLAAGSSTSIVVFDSVLPDVVDFAPDDYGSLVYGYGVHLSFTSDPEESFWTASFLIGDYTDAITNMVVYVDGVKASDPDRYAYTLYNGGRIWGVDAVLSVEDSNAFLGSSHRLWVNATDTYEDYMSQHQIVSGIASGLTSVQHYATSLVSGFDALALDNGALTNSMAFAFTLLGIGTAVGICKLTFNWITGRHGM